jgi:hypothetical protein
MTVFLKILVFDFMQELNVVSSDVQTDTLDQHIKAAVELFRRYIPPIFEAITVELFKNSNNYPYV